MYAKFCPRCGTPNASGAARFCIKCGQSLPVLPAAPVAAQAVASANAWTVGPTDAPAPVAAQASSGSGARVGGVVSEILSAVGGAPASAGLAAQLFSAVGALAGGGSSTQVASTLFNRVTHPRGHPVIVGGSKRDRPDPSDLHFDAHLSVDPANLPAMVDLRPHLTDVEDQGELGSCTANAIAGAYEYLQFRTTNHRGDVSRLFIYYLEREVDDCTDEDTGASLRDGMKVLRKHGVCSENSWPYDIEAFRNRPDEQAFAEAQAHTIDEYRRVPVDAHAMKVCLAEGYPFVFGMKIFKSFEAHGHHGKIRLPRSGEECLGSHAMLAVGYAEDDEVFIVRNSWGADWGDGGYCYVPFDYLGDEELTDDCWTLRRAHNLDFSANDDHVEGRRSFFDDDGVPLNAAEEWHRRRAAVDERHPEHAWDAEEDDDETDDTEEEADVDSADEDDCDEEDDCDDDCDCDDDDCDCEDESDD